MTTDGYCACGRSSQGKYSFRRHDSYCSRYCHDFMEKPVEGEKTAYDLWVGTGRYAYNPRYPQLKMNCAWCNKETPLRRAMEDANKWFCSSHCSKQANRNPKSTSARNGSSQISNRVRMMMILREFEGEALTAKQISHFYVSWFRKSCTPSKVSSCMQVMTGNGWVRKEDIGKIKGYRIVDTKTPLQTLFGETEMVLGRGEKA